MENRATTSKRYTLDCQYLHYYLSGDASANDLRNIIEILSGRNKGELRIIRQSYSATYNHDFLDLLSQKKDIFSRVAYLRASEPQDQDAEMIRRALFGGRLDLDILTELLCTRNSSELRTTKQAYLARYNSDVERDVSLKTNGVLKEILLAVLNSTRYDGARVDASMAMCDAKTLYEAIGNGMSIDQKSIISLISQRSTCQIKAILVSYKQLYGHEFLKFLRREKCREFGKQIRTVIRCIQFPEKHFAKQLRWTLKNGDAHEILIRIVATRSGIDIGSINAAFCAKTGWSLESVIRSEFSSSSNGKSNTLVADFLIALLKQS